MPSIVIASTEDQTLIIKLSVWEKLAAAKFSDLSIPLTAVSLPVRVRPEEARRCLKEGFKMGTEVPGGFTAGTFFHLHEARDFYYMSKAERTIGIDLTDHETYRKLIIEVAPEEEPEDVARKIEEAVRKVNPPKKLAT